MIRAPGCVRSNIYAGIELGTVAAEVIGIPLSLSDDAINPGFASPIHLGAACARRVELDHMVWLLRDDGASRLGTLCADRPRDRYGLPPFYYMFVH
jgi:hypothetical protein